MQFVDELISRRHGGMIGLVFIFVKEHNLS